MKIKIIPALAVLLSLLSLGSIESPFSVSWSSSKTRVEAGKEHKTDVIIRIPAGYHLYADKTELAFTSLDGIKIKKVGYPPPVDRVDPFSGKVNKVYQTGVISIEVVFDVPETLPRGSRELTAVLELQGCSEKLCMRPEEFFLSWPLEVSTSEGEMTEARPEKIVAGDWSLESLLKIKDFQQVLARGRLVVILVVFAAGLLTGLTPCVWPMIPITLMVVGVHKRSNVLGNLLLSMTIVLGLAVTYASLGLVASVAGDQIGFLFQSKVFVAVIGLLLVAMALSMFGLFTLNMPHGVLGLFSKLSGRGYKGAFLSGVAMGFMATPCVGPVLGPLLVWVSSQKEYLFGAELLAVYALGIGVFYIVIGTFYGTISGHLKDVKLGLYAKKLLGVLLLLVGLYYLGSLVGMNGNGSLPSGDWSANEPAAVLKARTEEKPLLIVFGARWCPPCQKLKKEILNDKNVAERLKTLSLLYVDASYETKEIASVLDKYGVVGLPTVLFVSSGGEVWHDLAFVGRVPDKVEIVKTIGEAERRALEKR